MKNEQELLAELRHFTGTTQWFHLPQFRNYRYTDGIRYLAQNAECYWLLETIFSNQLIGEIRVQPFQFWRVFVEDSSAVIKVEDGKKNLVKEFKIEYTDFPIKEFSLWFTDGVLLLPTEY